MLEPRYQKALNILNLKQAPALEPNKSEVLEICFALTTTNTSLDNLSELLLADLIYEKKSDYSKGNTPSVDELIETTREISNYFGELSNFEKFSVPSPLPKYEEDRLRSLKENIHKIRGFSIKLDSKIEELSFNKQTPSPASSKLGSGARNLAYILNQLMNLDSFPNLSDAECIKLSQEVCNNSLWTFCNEQLDESSLAQFKNSSMETIFKEYCTFFAHMNGYLKQSEGNFDFK